MDNFQPHTHYITPKAPSPGEPQKGVGCRVSLEITVGQVYRGGCVLAWHHAHERARYVGFNVVYVGHASVIYCVPILAWIMTILLSALACRGALQDYTYYPGMSMVTEATLRNLFAWAGASVLHYASYNSAQSSAAQDSLSIFYISNSLIENTGSMASSSLRPLVILGLGSAFALLATLVTMVCDADWGEKINYLALFWIVRCIFIGLIMAHYVSAAAGAGVGFGMFIFGAASSVLLATDPTTCCPDFFCKGSVMRRSWYLKSYSASTPMHISLTAIHCCSQLPQANQLRRDLNATIVTGGQRRIPAVLVFVNNTAPIVAIFFSFAYPNF
ncbi:hypothetical protein LX36DRAFT_671311 [Colletotrichum falcatum]|nr:hypothetical protein LX36DRAFT_671311 [Colletotrichum falcatum]